jgi:hypothetical protein
MVNKHEQSSVGVCLDDVRVPGWKLSGWVNTRATISYNNREKYSRSTLGVAIYLRSYWDRRADAGCCVLLRAPAQERPRKSEGPTPRGTNITTIIFPRTSKTAIFKLANEEGLLYLYFPPKNQQDLGHSVSTRPHFLDFSWWFILGRAKLKSSGDKTSPWKFLEKSVKIIICYVWNKHKFTTICRWLSSGLLYHVVWYTFTDVSEVLTASIIRAMMEAASTSETSVNFYKTTLSNNPQDSHLQKIFYGKSFPLYLW